MAGPVFRLSKFSGNINYDQNRDVYFGCDNGWMRDVCLIRCRSTSTDLEIETSEGLKNPSHCYLDKNVKITRR